MPAGRAARQTVVSPSPPVEPATGTTPRVRQGADHKTGGSETQARDAWEPLIFLGFPRGGETSARGASGGENGFGWCTPHLDNLLIHRRKRVGMALPSPLAGETGGREWDRTTDTTMSRTSAGGSHIGFGPELSRIRYPTGDCGRGPSRWRREVDERIRTRTKRRPDRRAREDRRDWLGSSRSRPCVRDP